MSDGEERVGGGEREGREEPVRDGDPHGSDEPVHRTDLGDRGGPVHATDPGDLDEPVNEREGMTAPAGGREAATEQTHPDAPGRATPDRRTFLRTAGAAGAALGLGAALPGDVAGARGASSGTAGSDTPGSRVASPSPESGAPYVSRQLPDVVVVGAGAFGAWTAFYLRRQGVDVMLVDKYGPGNSKATSGGETRGVRTSYGDRDHGRHWTRWASESIRRWKRYDEEWKDRIPAPLFFTTGDLIMREEEEPYLEETRGHWDALGIPYEVLDGDEVSRRWPAIRTDDVNVVLFEPDAGVVRARRAIEAVAGIFRSEGGRLRTAEVQVGRQADGGLQDVALDDGERLRAGSFVFALGPWFPSFFPEILGRRMNIPMGHVFYFGTPPGDQRFTWPNLPSYGVPGVTGWPALPPDNRGFRVRTGGSRHDDPDHSPRWVPEDMHERPRQIMADYFPGMADAALVETRTCHYEISISRNFIIDHHPDYSNVWLAGGGSAEAFKFGPVTGEYVAGRVLDRDVEPELAEGFRIPEEEYEGGGDE